MQDKNTVEQMRLIISEREKRVRELEDEMHKLKETLYTSFNNGNLVPGVAQIAREVTTTTTTTTIANNESEFMKSRPISTSSSRPPTGHRPDSNMTDREISSSRLVRNFNLLKL